MQHACYAERIWVRIRFAGEDAALDGVDWRRGGGQPRSRRPIATYEASGRSIDAIVDAHDLDDAMPDGNGPPPTAVSVPITLRWIVVHLIEELARHAGHADILRELLDGDTGR